jgi:hypothetical protein
LTSAEVTSRLTGGLKRTPRRSGILMVLPPSLTSGGPLARSGTGFLSPAFQP